jgi:hypothetical protein
MRIMSLEESIASHMLKDFPLWGTLTKNMYVYFCEYFHNSNDIEVYYNIDSLHKKLNTE